MSTVSLQAPALPRPADLITVAAAAKILPSSRAGKRLHLATVHRWISQGRLRAWRVRGPAKTMRYVSRAEVLALLVPFAPTHARPPLTPAQEEERRAQARRHMDAIRPRRREKIALTPKL